MDARAIGERLGKQAAVSDGGYAERMARVKQLVDSQPKTRLGGFMQGLGDGAAQGKASPAVSKVYAVLRGRNLTAAQRAQVEARWAARNSLKSWTDSANMTLGMVGGGGATTKGVALLARGGKAVAAAAQAAGAASKAPGLLRTTASTMGYFAVPRPAAMASMTLRLPAVLGKHVAAPAVRGTGRLLARIPGVRGAVSRVAATRGGQAVSRGVGQMGAGAQRIAQSRPMQALSNTAKFVEGRGGVGSKMFAVADAGVPMYAGIKYFDPESEAMARALGYDSQYVANVSPTPGMYVPAARMQSPLVNTIPSMVNERRMRDWIAQNQGSIVQEQTDARTQQVADQLSRRY